eukprot:7346047-Pyramimonas_sp.AAC.2
MRCNSGCNSGYASGCNSGCDSGRATHGRLTSSRRNVPRTVMGNSLGLECALGMPQASNGSTHP